MRALVYTAPFRLDVRDEPDPIPGNDEVLVRVEACGVCGSDMHAFHGHDERRPPPVILGHEIAGRITTGPRTGERVTVNPLVTCGFCEPCRDGRPHLCGHRQILSMNPRPGGFAELVRVPEANAIAIPADFPAVKAALCEPVAVGWHAVKLGQRLLQRPLAAASALVIGGGAIGLASALCLKLFGAGEVHVAEPNALRRATVARAGDFHCHAPGGAGEPAPGSVDLVVDAVGAEATRAAASRLVRAGGVIVHVGLLPGAGGLDIRRITLQEVVVTGSYCYTPQDFRDVAAALIAGRFGAPDWIEERPLRDGASAFRDIDAQNVAAAKIVLRP